MSIIKQITLVLFFALTLQAQSGLSQKHLVSLSPQDLAQDISADSSVEIRYDLAISKQYFDKRAIVLQNAKHKKVEGKVSINNDTTLIFTPSEALKSGEYKVSVKHIHLQDYTLNTRSIRYVRKFCSYFYDDVKQCKLYNYVTKVKTEPIEYSFSVDDNKPKVVSLTLNKSNIQLNEDNTTTISVNAKYDDNTTVDVTDGVEWLLSNSNIVKIDKNIITPLSEGTTTLQAKLNNQTTQEISITVYKVISGYRLPPEPDPTINNSTLLGIDVNNNGVRDDVERKIIKTYREPIKITYMMQIAKIGQEILENPVGAAQEHSDKMDKLGDCGMYIDDLNISFDILQSVKFYENNMYNTKARVRAYLDYNLALSGGAYGSSPSDWTSKSCDFDVDAMLGAKK